MYETSSLNALFHSHGHTGFAEEGEIVSPKIHALDSEEDEEDIEDEEEDTEEEDEEEDIKEEVEEEEEEDEGEEDLEDEEVILLHCYSAVKVM